MEKQIASFREFLSTGRLGPLHHCMTLMDVARVLGPPEDWITSEEQTVPVYWKFGKVEISFDETAPHRMHWFQIEHAEHLQGEFDAITDDLVLALDGIDGTTKPSEFLSAGLWSPDIASVCCETSHGDASMCICAGNVQILFRIDLRTADDGWPRGDSDRFSLSELTGAIERSARLDSVYSYPGPAREYLPASLGWRIIDSRNYLASLTVK
jgi:hypothetical protein